MKEYPRGCHPNSLKALEENRHKGMFTKRKSKAAARKSAILRHTLKEAVQYGLIYEDDETWEQIMSKVWESLKDAAMEGDTKAAMLLFKCLL